MKTIESPPAIDPVIEMLTTGKPIPPEIRDRLRAEARRLTEELRKTHGVQSISAELIRECRNE